MTAVCRTLSAFFCTAYGIHTHTTVGSWVYPSPVHWYHIMSCCLSVATQSQVGFTHCDMQEAPTD